MPELKHDIWFFGDLLLKRRMLEAEQPQAPSFPVFRNMHFASRAEVETLFDRLALELGMRAHRLGSAELVLSGDDALVSAAASRKEDYCSCTFDIWAASVERADGLRRAIEGLAGDTILHDAMFTMTGTSSLPRASCRAPTSKRRPTTCCWTSPIRKSRAASTRSCATTWRPTRRSW